MSLTEEDPVICNCLQVRLSEIKSVLRQQNLKSYRELAKELGVGGICGGCRPKCQKIVAEYLENQNKHIDDL